MTASRRPDRHYQQIADVYRWNGRTGCLVLIAELWDVPHSTAARWVRRARQLGYLAPDATRPCRLCGCTCRGAER